MSDRTKGLLLGALGAATYGMNPLFALPLYKAGLDADSVLFWRYLLGVALLALVMGARRASFKVAKRALLPLAAAGVLFSASSLFLFLSYTRMDAGVASTILFVYPVMVAAIMAVFFRERVTVASAGSLALALAGIALLRRGGDGAAVSTAGIGMVLASALSYAIYIVGVKKTVLKTLPGDRLTFYALAFGLLVFVARLDFGASLAVPGSAFAWGCAVGLGAFPTVVSLVCTARAIQLVGATPTAILGALEPVTAVFFGVAVFHEPLTGRLIVGIATILAAVTLLVLGQKPDAPGAAPEPDAPDASGRGPIPFPPKR